MNVAIIEDTEAIAHMYQTRLEQEGWEVRVAGDGNKGMELLSEYHPDVVLLDIMMPESSGVDVLSYLRRSKENDNIKVIVMTNLDDTKLRQSLAEFKVSDYLVKAEVTPWALV
jgi:DNA-binding response OmpR family regulator